MKPLKGISEEQRKIRWSDSKKSTAVFIATVVTILIFILLVAGFSWVIASIINLA